MTREIRHTEIGWEFLYEDVRRKRESCKFHHSSDLLGHVLNDHEVTDLVSKVVEHADHVYCRGTSLGERGSLFSFIEGLVYKGCMGQSDFVLAKSGCRPYGPVFRRKLLFQASPTGVEVLP